jgi:hypothetical protein
MTNNSCNLRLCHLGIYDFKGNILTLEGAYLTAYIVTSIRVRLRNISSKELAISHLDMIKYSSTKASIDKSLILKVGIEILNEGITYVYHIVKV